jgi:hypothetical protein
MWLNRERGVVDNRHRTSVCCSDFHKAENVKNIEISEVPAPYPDFLK